MKLTINLDRSDMTPAVAEAMAVFLGVIPEAATPARRTAPAPEVPPAGDALPETPADVTPAEDTKDTVMKALRTHAQEHGRDAAIQVLKDHGASNVSSLDPGKYQDVLFVLEAA